MKSVAKLPHGVSCGIVLAGGFLASIGFTMALFIAGLALQTNVELLDTAKISILAGSLISAVAGMCLMVFFTRGAASPIDEE